MSNLTHILRAIPPEERGLRGSWLLAREMLPIAIDGVEGDFACGHCGLTLGRGVPALAAPEDTGEPFYVDVMPTLLCCPGCGWENELPLG